MAERAYAAPSSGPMANHYVYSWSSLAGATSDFGTALQLPHLTDRSVQVQCSAFNGTTVYIEGSNDGTNYHTLTDQFGDPLEFTANGLRAITEPVAYIRPRCNAGTGESIVVTLFMR
jgi:hypothetical protein